MYEHRRHGLGQDITEGWVDVGGGWEAKRSDATGIPFMRVFARLRPGQSEALPEGMTCTCYEQMGRGIIAPVTLPYSLEVKTLGKHFKCACNPRMQCPESVHRGVSTRDPWRAEVCRGWINDTKRVATQMIEGEEFRAQMAKAVAKGGEVPGWQQLFMAPAEFTEVLVERERRERPIMILGVIAIAAGGGFLLWKYLRGRER
jgi:hypothetical protein